MARGNVLSMRFKEWGVKRGRGDGVIAGCGEFHGVLITVMGVQPATYVRSQRAISEIDLRDGLGPEADPRRN